MAKHRSHSIEFKRQVAQEFLAGETLHGLAKRHDVIAQPDPHLGRANMRTARSTTMRRPLT